MSSEIRSEIRVLVVDGRLGIADLLVGILHMSGYDARVLDGVTDATRVAEKFRPHVLISDVKIPPMDGFELSAELVQRFPGSPVFCSTCNVYEADQHEDSSSLKDVREFAHMDELFHFLDACVGTLDVQGRVPA
jgi:CheY-like chemotaxis protein